MLCRGAIYRYFSEGTLTLLRKFEFDLVESEHAGSTADGFVQAVGEGRTGADVGLPELYCQDGLP